MNIKFVLVTGATGFIGAHIVDALLARGIRVRGATRSLAKADAMLQMRKHHADLLEFVQIEDFENPGGLVEAVKNVDGIVHTASVSDSTQDDDTMQHADSLILSSPLHTIHKTTRKNSFALQSTE
jgi:uncharacterized protein YbjT (DUF2867 family)